MGENMWVCPFTLEEPSYSPDGGMLPLNASNCGAKTQVAVTKAKFVLQLLEVNGAKSMRCWTAK